MKVCKLIIIAIALIILLIGACTINPTGKITEEKTIKIGSILILSGSSGGASLGNAERNGIDMAIEEINSKGGVLGRKLEADQ